MQDYPLVDVAGVTILDVPEEVADRFTYTESGPLPNITDEVKGTVARDDLQKYLETLRESVGNLLDPKSILPPFQLDNYFSYAYRIPDSITELPYYLIVRDLEETELSWRDQRDGGVAVVQLWSRGPNMGSAGGPTITPVLDLAEIQYKGQFLPGEIK